MRAVKCDRMDGGESFSMAEDMWSGPLLMEYAELRAERTWESVTTLKKKGIPFRFGVMGELRIPSRSEGTRGRWRLVTDEKWVLRIDRGVKAEADGGCFFRVPIDRSCCQRMLRIRVREDVANVVIFRCVKSIRHIRSKKRKGLFQGWYIGMRSNFVDFIPLFHEVLYLKSYPRFLFRGYRYGTDRSKFVK